MMVTVSHITLTTIVAQRLQLLYVASCACDGDIKSDNTFDDRSTMVTVAISS